MTGKSFRRDERVTVTLDCLVHTAHERIRGRILDLGLGGLSLSLDRDLEPATLLEVEFSLPQSEPRSLRIPAKVQWCRNQENQWYLGLEFADPPGASLMDIAEWLARIPRTGELP